MKRGQDPDEQQVGLRARGAQPPHQPHNLDQSGGSHQPGGEPRELGAPRELGGRPESGEPAAPRGAMFGFLRETVLVVGTALVLSLLVKTFLLQAFFIPSQSMQDTLQIGDRVLVNKLSPDVFDLDRGDIVVFQDPGDWLPPPQADQRGPLARAVASVLTFVGLLPQDAGDHLIKRIVGLPGDRVVCCDEEGRLSVNGEPLDEPYLFPGSSPSELDFDVQVPAGQLWVMGDNRQMSEDSRYHQDSESLGTVPVDLVVGRAFVIVWPLDRISMLSAADGPHDGVPAVSSEL